MPHQCTECGRTFPDGSKEMLSGCPDCGGNKFQFQPSDAVDVEPTGSVDGSASVSGDSVGAMSRAKETVKGLMGRGSDDDGETGGSESGPTQASLSEFESQSHATADASQAESTPDSSRETPTDAPAETATDSARGTSPDSSTADADPRESDVDREPVTPSGDGEWPKSGTEEYDTPSEKARRREDAPAAEDARPSSDTATDGTAPAPDDSPSVAEGADAKGAGAPDESGSSAGDDGHITAQMGETEDDAQRSARSDVVSPDELPSGAGSSVPGSQPEPERSATGTPTGASTGPARKSGTPSSTEPSTAGSGMAPTDGVDRADRPPSRGDSDLDGPPSGGEVASEPSEDAPDLDELREELNSQFESIKVLDPGKYELNLMELYDREEYIISLQEDGRYVIEVPESWRGEAGPE